MATIKPNRARSPRMEATCSLVDLFLAIMSRQDFAEAPTGTSNRLSKDRESAVTTVYNLGPSAGDRANKAGGFGTTPTC